MSGFSREKMPCGCYDTCRCGSKTNTPKPKSYSNYSPESRCPAEAASALPLKEEPLTSPTKNSPSSNVDLPFGWLTDAEATRLYNIAFGILGPVLEIGSYHGRSTIILSRATDGLVYSVDPHDGIEGGESSWGPFLTTLVRHDCHNIVPFRMTSNAFSRIDPDRNYGLIFIDADHSFEAVLADLLNFVPKVRPGGFIALHDFGTGAYPGVAQAWNEICGYGSYRFTDVSVHDSLLVARVAR